LNVVPKLEVVEESTHILVLVIERMNRGSFVHGVFSAKWREIHLGKSSVGILMCFGKRWRRRSAKSSEKCDAFLSTRRLRE
jgi:hypothetical protein